MEEQLEFRIVRIERQNRWLKWLGGMGFIVLGSVLLMEQMVPEEIRARAFQVVDQDGTTRVTLSAIGKGAGLLINDDAGRPLAILSAMLVG